MTDERISDVSVLSDIIEIRNSHDDVHEVITEITVF